MIFFAVQTALWLYGRNVALQAAREGVSQLRLVQPDSDVAASQEAVEESVVDYAVALGRESLLGPQAESAYDADTGKFLTPTSQPCCYYASDNLESKRYRGLTPFDLVDIAVVNGLHFHAATGEGVAFHLIGALSEFGKLGVVCIAQTHERADSLYRKTVDILDRESTPSSSDDPSG